MDHHDHEHEHEHEQEQRRDPMFAALRAEMDKLNAPRGVEKELMQAFARQFPRKRRWWEALPALPRSWALAGSLASIAVAVLAFALAVVRPLAEDARHPLLAHASAQDGGGLFIALDSADRIESEPNPRLVETEVARTALAPLGVPLTPENAGQKVKAEMLVAADGQPLALRLSSAN
jgi:hypothetical protein